MSISEELGQLGELHQRGMLSDDEFSRAKARVLDAAPPGRPGAANGAGPSPGPGPFVGALNALQRSRDERWLGGVCGGLAQSFGPAPWVWRLMFTLLVLCAGTGVFVYLLLWVLLPLAPASFNGHAGGAHASR